MNTPSHYIVNLAILGKKFSPQANLAIGIGAILPDVPIFIFYFVAKFIHKMPDSQIWSEAYYQPFWQNIIALFHSFPMALIGLIACWYWGWKPGAILFGSMILHSCFDLPVHNDDAHRHLYPFSNYRFISPISYWDPRHYGKIVALVELISVLILTPLVFGFLRSWTTKSLVIAVELFAIVGYFRFYVL